MQIYYKIFYILFINIKAIPSWFVYTRFLIIEHDIINECIIEVEFLFDLLFT